jgi:hypothetical protein
MRTGEACHIHGKVSHSLLVNMTEFTMAWNRFLPNKYNPLEITADDILDSRVPSKEQSWIMAYSGGVDATATLLRHTRSPIGIRARPVKAAMLVHGFDVPLNKPEAFEIAKQSAKKITDSVGVELLTMRTNLRTLDDIWEHAFAPYLVSTLALMNTKYDGGLFSGDNNPYEVINIPWGSNPVTNHLMGSDHFPIYTDSMEMSRLKKVGLLKGWIEAEENVRLCWSGPMTGKNCGVCFKCVMTQVEFLYHGLDTSKAFLKTIKPGDIKSIYAQTWPLVNLLKNTVDACDRDGIKEWWVEEVRTVVRRGPRSPKQPFLSKYRGKLGIRKKLRELRGITQSLIAYTCLSSAVLPLTAL